MSSRALVLLPLIVLPASPALGRDLTPVAVKKAVESAIDVPAFRNAFWGVEVRSLKSGRTLYARNEERHLKPASTLKLLTTAAALDRLGPEATVRTTLETSAHVDGGGRLLGDLLLVGRGDPNLSGRFTEGRITAALEGMADQLAAAGVKRVEGRLVGHEGLFSGDRRGDDWTWGDLVWWYGAEVSALSFNDNCVDLKVGPGERVGDPIVVDLDPVSRYYTLTSSATTAAAGTKSTLTLTRDPGNQIRITGTLAQDARPYDLYVAMEDPARYTATVFAELLAARGISVRGGVATSRDPLASDLRVLATHVGRPLSDVIQAVNKPSQNLHAEILLRLLGAHAGGDGSADGGHEVVQGFLAGAGVAADAVALQDGSGLSRSDLLSPRSLVQLLVAMDRHPHAAVFRDSLPVAGVDGTLKNRMKGTAAEGRVAAKTGTIRHVNALAGYLTTRSGERLAFAFLANHHTVPGSQATAAMDAILATLAGS